MTTFSTKENFEFFKKIEEKWQNIWKKTKIFEPEVDESKPKYFITIPYPYVNGLPHLGHGFTFSRGEFTARFKRMKGFNVLWPQGWHATGAPIVGAALQVKERNEKWIKTLKSYGISDQEIKNFENPEYWVYYFSKRWKKAFEMIGFSIDWRREFFTTFLNKAYSKFIEWQYRKLKEKGLVKKGKHPVVWDPKVKKVIGDHDRPDEYAGISPMEVILIKFKDESGRVYPCATFRPETVYGVTNLWVREDGDYVEARVDNETWIVSKEVIEEIKDQEHEVEVLKEIKGSELLGIYVINQVTNEKVPILPASFVDLEIGTGVVMSVPAHAPYDWIALEDLKNDEKWEKIARELKPKSLFKLKGYSEFPAKDVCEKYGIKSQKEKEKLERATKEIYNKEFYDGVLKEFFGKYANKKICEIKDELVNELIQKDIALKHYILPIRFKSRYGGKVHVKIIKNQWFLKYSDEKWKELAHECVDQMEFYPENLREIFHSKIDWYKDWAFTHQRELGEFLPWDKNWTIESLSDSTIYMAYYVVAKYLENAKNFGIDVEKINDEFFDYVFLGVGDSEKIAEKIGVKKELLEEIRKEFEYWYPVDLRNSGKDLITNHLVFYIFHHAILFPKHKWPRRITINGYVMINGEKMSKSKGNVIPIEKAVSDYSADVVRFLLAYAGNSGMDDANIEISNAETVANELKAWYDFAVNNYNKGREEKIGIDEWFEAIINKTIKEVEKEYENLNFKNVLIKGFYEFQNDFKWYKRRCLNNFNKQVINKFILTQTLILYPIVPHLCSEILEKIGKDALKPKWPKPKEIDESVIKKEEFVKTVVEDINEIKRILKIEKIKKIKIIIPASIKYEIFERAKEILEKCENPREVMKLAKEFKNIEILKKIVKNISIVSNFLPKEFEEKTLKEAKTFLEKEFDCEVIIEDESESKEEKARMSIPGKPAIVIY